MIKTLTILATTLIVALALIPPIQFFIYFPDQNLWPWAMTLIAFAGFLLFFIKTSFAVKAVSFLSFVNCFAVGGGLLAFQNHALIVFACYFFILYTKIDFKITGKAIAAIILLNLFLLIVQHFNADSMLNFGIDRSRVHGVVGQSMQMGSFSVILSAAALPFAWWMIFFPIVTGLMIGSSWAIFSAAVGIFVFFMCMGLRILAVLFAGAVIVLFLSVCISQNKIGSNLGIGGRAKAWKETAKLTLEHPVKGWGGGKFKYIFPALGSKHHKPYTTAHNFFLQFAFEFGWPLTILVGLCLAWLFWKLIVIGAFDLATGLSMIVVNAQVHFPDRMIQTVLIIVFFLAMCHRRIANDRT
jgi:O-antigen ligase